jgi:hypothetical protein
MWLTSAPLNENQRATLESSPSGVASSRSEAENADGLRCGGLCDVLRSGRGAGGERQHPRDSPRRVRDSWSREIRGTWGIRDSGLEDQG